MSASLRERFVELADAWEQHLEAERASSNPQRKLAHPAFEELVSLGEAAVPLVVERYQQGSLFWGAALARLTGVTAHGDGLSGNLRETRTRWLAWWRENEARFPSAE